MIVEAARAYSDGNEGPWLRIALAIAESTVSTLYSEAESLRAHFDLDDSVLGDHLLAWIIDPGTVHMVSSLNKDAVAKEWLAKEIASWLQSYELHLRRIETHRGDDVVDFGDSLFGYGPIERWRGGEEDSYEDAPRMLSLHESFSIDTDSDFVSKCIEKISDHDLPSAVKSKKSVLVRPIDPILYRALIENPDLMKSLDWRVFETLLADIITRFGYEVDLQQGTKDGGIDIFAIRKSSDFGEQRHLIQAKRWSNRVGVEPVRELMFLHSHHKVTKSCLATTSSFTKGAWELANTYKWQLELRDMIGIHEWLVKASGNLGDA